MPENDWINCSDYASVLDMPNIVLITLSLLYNVIILEFLSAWFVHLGTLLPFYLFLTQVTT